MRRTLPGLVLLPALLLTCAAWPQGYAPDVAPRKMTTPSGFAVSLVAAEPLVRQPVCIEFDDRGRLWVVQYLQYPNPAGLKRVKVDRYSRAVYDRVPEPPPRGPRGADRITILEDADGDGRADRARDFVRGLNLASGIAFGHGGVFVLQVPYLLFYPDKDGDDVSDSDPEVLLSGFGMEDAHSVANSLTWGPDGWLYGCQGSTVTARVRDPVSGRVNEFQQGVWRYHPLSRRFELFCEGGGNSWGLDFDRLGNLLYSTNVGGHCLLHGVQGGYYWKSFGKHGALHNRHAYGYFDHVPHAGFRGGHVTVGGSVYGGTSFPPEFRGRYIAADLLGHNVYWHDLSPAGSSFRARHGGELLLSNDTWFAPSDLTLGPDGAVYVADWHDARTAHPDPDAEWDRSNGRVYRITWKGTKPYTGGDLRKLPRDKLLALLSSPEGWLVRKARRILADRRDPELIFPLRTLVTESKDEQVALEALWALYVSGGFTERFAATALEHRSAPVRRWAVRFLGDEGKVSASLGKALARLAEGEPDVHVRSQLASSAARLPAETALPIVRALVLRDKDSADPHIPLLLWWAVEKHALAATEELVSFFSSERAWNSGLARETIRPRLVRRLAAEGAAATLAASARLISSFPTSADRAALLRALEQGLGERGPDKAETADSPGELNKLVARLWRDDTEDASLIRIRVRLGHEAGQRRALALACDGHAPVDARQAVLGILGELGRPECGPALLPLLDADQPASVRRAALEALPRFPQKEVGRALLQRYPRLPAELRARTREVLLSRRGWAELTLEAVDAGKLPATDFSHEQLRAVALYGDDRLNALVRKHWGSVRTATPEEKLADVRRLNNDLRAASGDPGRGQGLFVKLCGTCHKLFGAGKDIGPDLTFANRRDRDFLLVSLVDPSAVIRKEYLAHIVHTRDGRVLAGILAEQGAGSVVLLAADGSRTTLPRAGIETMEESPVSLMPEGLLKDLEPQELRDLFAYLQSDRPPARRPGGKP